MSDPIGAAAISGLGGVHTPLAGRTVTWTSSVPGVCAAPASGTTDASGTVSATLTMLAAGTTNLQATCGGKTSNVVVVVAVAQAAVSTVTASPTSLSGLVGSSGVLSAVVKDGSSNVLSGRVVTWSTSNAAVAAWSGGSGSTLTVHYLTAGSANVQAWCEGVGSNVVTVTVSASAAPVAKVTVAPTSLSGTVGGSAALTATCTDANGGVLGGRRVDWTSSAPSVASVVSPGQSTTVSYLAQGAASITATSETINSTSVGVTVGAASGVAYPNQPAGFTRFAENTCAGVAGSTTGTPLAGSWSFYNQDSNNFFASDGSDPVSPPGIWVANLYVGMPAGIGPGGGFAGWNAAGNATTYRQLYMAFWFRVREATYEAKVYPGTKIALVGYNSPISSGSNDGIIEILSGGQAFGSAFQLAFIQQNNVARQMSPNVNTSSLFTCAAWHRIETVLLLNSAMGVADGTFKMWIDGIQTHNYTDVKYITTTTNAFFSQKWEITWGGGPGTRTTDNHLDYAHAYLSGIR